VDSGEDFFVRRAGFGMRRPRCTRNPSRCGAELVAASINAAAVAIGAAPSTRRLSAHDFLPGGLIAWPVALCDFLYSDIELFGLSDFGFLASLLLRIWPFAIDPSMRQPRQGRRMQL
jgi:hypothetical protein